MGERESTKQSKEAAPGRQATDCVLAFYIGATMPATKKNTKRKSSDAKRNSGASEQPVATEVQVRLPCESCLSALITRFSCTAVL